MKQEFHIITPSFCLNNVFYTIFELHLDLLVNTQRYLDKWIFYFKFYFSEITCAPCTFLDFYGLKAFFIIFHQISSTFDTGNQKTQKSQKVIPLIYIYLFKESFCICVCVLRRIREIADFRQTVKNCLIHKKSNPLADFTHPAKSCLIHE